METEHPLKVWRKANNRMTLAELAKELGVSAPHLSEIENGNNEPSLELAIAIGERTGIPVQNLSNRRRAGSAEAV